MKKFWPYAIITGIVFIFFYKTILFGRIPFPGDLLLSQYAPWRHVSYFGYVAGAIPSKDQYFDIIRELYPWKTESIRQIKSFSAPLWNPYSFSGSPLLANYQSQVFYPFNILYFIMPQAYALTIIVMLQPLLSSIFTYLFAIAIGISPIGAVVAAIAFSFSSFSNVWMEFGTVGHTILWLPLLLFIIERLIKEKHLPIRLQVLFIFGLFSSITAGHPQDFINCFLFFMVYTVSRIFFEKSLSKKEKFYFFIHPLSYLIAIPFFIAMPQLLPTIELFIHSARVPHDYRLILQTMLIQPGELVLIAVQEFFGNPATKTNFLANSYVGKAISIGSAGCILSFFSLSAWKKFHVRFFVIASFVVLLYCVNTPLATLIHRYPLPLLSTGTPTRMLFLFCFCLSLLAGFGITELVKWKKFTLKPLFVVLPILFGIWYIAVFTPSFLGIPFPDTAKNIMVKSSLIATAIILGTLVTIYISIWKKLAAYIFIAIVSVELFYGFIKFNPFVPVTFVFPENPLLTYFQNFHTIDRIWGFGTAQMEANFSTQYQLFSPDGTDPLNLKWYNEFVQGSRNGHIGSSFNRSTRSDALVAPGYGACDLRDNPYRMKILDLLGVKYIVDRTENPKDNQTFTKDRFKEIWKKDDWTVYENLLASPRYFLTDQVMYYTSKEDFENKFFSPTFDPKTHVLMEQNQKNKLPPLSLSEKSIKLISYTPNEILFETKTKGNGILFLSDTYDYGWKAFVDSKQTSVIKTDYAFRGIVIPTGKHSIKFMYKPKSFTLGLWFSLIGILGMFLLVAFQKYTVIDEGKDSKNKKPNT